LVLLQVIRGTKATTLDAVMKSRMRKNWAAVADGAATRQESHGITMQRVQRARSTPPPGRCACSFAWASVQRKVFELVGAAAPGLSPVTSGISY